MKRSTKRLCITALLLPFVVAAVFFLHWAWKYYGLPELPDRREYKTIAERAEKALLFAQRHNMNEDYALFTEARIKDGLNGLAAGQSVADLLRQMLAVVRQYAGNAEQSDDITMLGLRYKGK